MIVLGLDLAPKRVGIALASTEGRRYCTSAAISGPADLRNLLAVIADTPDVVAVEDATVGAIGGERKARMGFIMGQANMACDRRWPDAAWVEYVPAEWRKLAGVRRWGNPELSSREQWKCGAGARAVELGFMPVDEDDNLDDDAAEAALIAYAALVDPRLVEGAAA